MRVVSEQRYYKIQLWMNLVGVDERLVGNARLPKVVGSFEKCSASGRVRTHTASSGFLFESCSRFYKNNHCNGTSLCFFEIHLPLLHWLLLEDGQAVCFGRCSVGAETSVLGQGSS